MGGDAGGLDADGLPRFLRSLVSLPRTGPGGLPGWGMLSAAVLSAAVLPSGRLSADEYLPAGNLGGATDSAESMRL